MFGIGITEILVILAIALIILGPKGLPELARTLGKAVGEFKRTSEEIKDAIEFESLDNSDHSEKDDHSEGGEEKEKS